jgi:N-acetylglucosamine-6-phosphate deacetylase
MHTHGILDVDFMECDTDSGIRALREYASHGVTRVVATTMANPLEAVIGQAKRLGKVMRDGSFGQILHGVHVEGPWLAPRCRGGHALEHLRVPSDSDTERLLGEAGDVVKSVTFAPELPGSVALVERLARAGILASIGHTEASFEEAERAILAGARHATHFYDTNLGYREDPDEALVMLPGHETAILLHDEVSVELIGCPVHVRKPFFRFIDKVKPRDKKVIVTDSLAGTGLGDGSIITYGDGRKAYTEDAVLRMIDDDPRVNGNLTGSAVTMDLALRRLGEFTGLPPEESLRWGSANPAVALGIGGETGTIAVGKAADIVVLDEAFRVMLTVVKGMPLYRAGDEVAWR